MREKLAKLIDVKSMVTLLLTIVFAALALMGKVSATEFMEVFKIIMIFYFGTQAAKNITTK